MNHLKFWFTAALIYLGLVCWSMNSWISMWIIMEVSLLFMVGSLSMSSGYECCSLMMKYYLIQLIISLSFMLLILVVLYNSMYALSFSCLILLLAKLGMFPFHYWMIMVAGKLNWLSFFIMNSFYKLPPLSIVYFMFDMIQLSFIILFTVLLGGCLGLNNISIQKLLIYSSMMHFCWMFISLIFSISLYWFYFFGYSLTLMIMVFICFYLNTFYLNQMKLIFPSSVCCMFYMFIMMSLAGLPPFIGFLMKWVVVKFLVFSSMKFALVFMVMFSVIAMMFYFQLFYYFLLMFSMSLKWYKAQLASKVSCWLVGLLVLSTLFIYVLL